MEDRSLLEVHEVTRSFGGLRALNRCSFRVEEGSVTSLIGPNGAGKTTMFNVITGLLRPSAGHVVFDGRDITGLRPHWIARQKIGRTFQLPRELEEMTLVENVVLHAPSKGPLGLFRSGVLEHERRKASDLLAFVDLDGLADEPAGSLSYGQRKLLDLAAALMADPRLIMLDEPAGGVNPALLETITSRVADLNRTGVTFLIVEHNMDVVMQLSDSVVVMAHGQVLTQAPPHAVQVDDVVLDAYLGQA